MSLDFPVLLFVPSFPLHLWTLIFSLHRRLLVSLPPHSLLSSLPEAHSRECRLLHNCIFFFLAVSLFVPSPPPFPFPAVLFSFGFRRSRFSRLRFPGFLPIFFFFGFLPLDFSTSPLCDRYSRFPFPRPSYNFLPLVTLLFDFPAEKVLAPAFFR